MIQEKIDQCLKDSMDVHFMTLENESSMHNVPAGSESHFKLILASDAFKGKRLVQRHQLVYSILSEEMKQIHALAMHLYTQKEWTERNEMAPSSPQCHGGE
ncbi:BolA/IbaG family iron-sulfur metabolism protein [Marinomonas sp. IMCC 4694]|uniref:BolA/IbaG family iron-sulfur metabolism protein n=1 Tax=Marinomonas sp. IMCC 4694 TaxID=2605432 RepID=UPI0011E6B7C8|nr:BolA/IbaG family iron-sulfur metabolism protein [Marinomonas sp. IMCC 4694]TYL47858.1 BolA/IbaG family iron-sulfur metabolism protein [Marinomonas sp. IMCC 4694]